MEKRPLTELLVAWNRGEEGALNELLPEVSDELHKIAGAYMRDERVNHTLQPTALIHECYVRLLEREAVNWRDRSHFFAFAAKTMRRILVDHARARQTAKRGGGVEPLTLESYLGSESSGIVDLIAIDDAMLRLSCLDGRLGKLVEMRLFAGLNNREIAEVLDVGEATVGRDWVRARAWLARELGGQDRR